ncbi:MAG: hypothetical protein HND52_18175 [Ignavibacteriae bacterium]|nr:hypothetical protein [Ignavibacteriota bacterium]NOG99890.1 hypothetical protein [Ignavibacteriota bacterium]
MKLPKPILLKLKIASAKAECERDDIKFYPKWILPAKLILILVTVIYLSLLFLNQQKINFAEYKTLMNILLFTGAFGISVIAVKNLIFSFLGYLKVHTSPAERNRSPVTMIIKLGFDKRINMQSINSVLQQDYKNIELILLSNIKTKYSDFDKSILKINKNANSKIKVSLVYSSNTSEMELLNIGIKTASTKIIAIIKSYTVIEKKALSKAINHLMDENILGVIGREIKNSKISFGAFTEIFNGLKFNLTDDLLINLNGMVLFRKEERAEINFVSLGINKIITSVVSQSKGGKKFIYDPNVKIKMIVKNNLFNRMNKLVEINLLKFDVLLKQWNYTFLKGGKFSEKLSLNWRIFKVSFIPLLNILYSIIFILTAIVSNNLEYVFFITSVLIITNFFISIFTIAIDFSMTKYILHSTLFKWFTDYLRLTLKIFTTNKKIFNSSLIYVPMRK